MDDESLNGKTIVITGASSGFGRGAALEFARQGANVVLGARRDDLLDELAQQCKAAGGDARAVATDVSVRDEVEALAKTALREFGRIDVWVNNAGVAAIGRFEDVPIDVHAQVVATNLLGTLYGSYVAWRLFLDEEKGILINIASELGVMTVPYYASYAAAKHGIVGLSQVLRQELQTNHAGDGVSVCLVMPTAHDTPFFDHAANYTGKQVQAPSPLHDPENVVETIVALARNPKDERIVGADGIVKLLMKKLAPGAAEKMAAKQMHKTQFEDAPTGVNTPGAVQSPVAIGAGVDGGRRRDDAV